MECETIEDVGKSRQGDSPSVFGLLVAFSGEIPRFHVVRAEGSAVELGRDELSSWGIVDGRVSRRHLRVEAKGKRLLVRDRESRNGTFVDGQPVRGGWEGEWPGVIRIGQTLLLPLADVAPFEDPGLRVDGGLVMGPALAAVHERIAALGRGGGSLLLRGASGSGKELAARAFHEAASGKAPAHGATKATGAGGGPFVAVNCATIPREIAERVLFGAKKGAFTGASTDSEGLVQAADGGTLFLDEIAELEAAVQAKLLRVLETREVTPLGAVTPTRVSVRFCSATYKDLRAEVSAGRFREDLYFRVGRPELRLPPLSERREEIPWLISQALSSLEQPLAASAEFVEACLVRPWPGNVRELLAEVKSSALFASAEGASRLGSSALDESAGQQLRAGERDEEDGSSRSSPRRAEEVEAALRAERGNVVRAAARLGLTRASLRRVITRHGIDVDALRKS